jgi:putative glutamine amidotransferase
MARPLLIGISARIHHPRGQVLDLGGVYTRTLHYLEQSVAHWVLGKGVLAVMIPAIESKGLLQRGEMSLAAYAQHLDGLVLQGGADVAPPSYGETPLAPEWAGDAVRDRYEIDLFEAFVEAGKPVLGICRGCQVINVALGGTLYQDLPTQVGQAIAHRDVDLYERALHDVTLVPDSALARLYPGTRRAKVNSIHHQAVKDLGRDLVVEAVGEPDGVVEAIRWRGPSYVFGIQWHPEFLALQAPDASLLDGAPIREEFLARADAQRGV